MKAVADRQTEREREKTEHEVRRNGHEEGARVKERWRRKSKKG